VRSLANSHEHKGFAHVGRKGGNVDEGRHSRIVAGLGYDRAAITVKKKKKDNRKNEK
jgi:hypothetical protein